jgi:flagellar biosynthesis anti-sigma factor FlgM
MTDKAARLQAIESSLASTPQVNDSLVAEISQSIAAGNLEIDLERIASKLVEFQPSVPDSDANQG